MGCLLPCSLALFGPLALAFFIPRILGTSLGAALAGVAAMVGLCLAVLAIEEILYRGAAIDRLRVLLGHTNAAAAASGDPQLSPSDGLAQSVSRKKVIGTDRVAGWSPTGGSNWVRWIFLAAHAATLSGTPVFVITVAEDTSPFHAKIARMVIRPWMFGSSARPLL